MVRSDRGQCADALVFAQSEIEHWSAYWKATKVVKPVIGAVISTIDGDTRKLASVLEKRLRERCGNYFWSALNPEEAAGTIRALICDMNIWEFAYKPDPVQGDDNFAIARAVHSDHPHRITRGDSMGRKYDATYKSKKGKAIIHVVAPPPMAEEQVKAGIAEMHRAAWAIWNSLSVEERIKINFEYEQTKGESFNGTASKRPP